MARALRPNLRCIAINLSGVFYDPSIRPPVLEEMNPDIERTIHKLALQYSDHTCPQLNFEDLVAEGRYKLAQLLNKGALERQPTRSNFFKFFKTSVANQFRSLVQKYRFTHKRTGAKPPPRHRPGDPPPTALELEAEQNYRKPVDVSMDDPDANVQVPDIGHEPHAEQEAMQEYLPILTPIEQCVFMELVQPSQRTLIAAQEDAYIGRKPGGMKVRITDKHRAYGCGIIEELFAEAVLSIRTKIKDQLAMTTDQSIERARYSATVQQLCQIYGVQVPASTEDSVVRRLFTVAARDQYTKVRDNPQIGDLLIEIGATPPRVYGDQLSCYGVLYTRTDKRCAACDLRQSCAVEAANVGLGKITLSPKLLGAKMLRFPAILPTMICDVVREPKASTSATMDQMEVQAYLEENFTRTHRDKDIYYIHKPYGDNSKKRKLLFCLEARNTPYRVRFCNPSENLRAKLVGKQKSWYAADNAPSSTVIDLIDQHARECFEAEHAEAVNA